MLPLTAGAVAAAATSNLLVACSPKNDHFSHDDLNLIHSRHTNAAAKFQQQQQQKKVYLTSTNSFEVYSTESTGYTDNSAGSSASSGSDHTLTLATATTRKHSSQQFASGGKSDLSPSAANSFVRYQGCGGVGGKQPLNASSLDLLNSLVSISGLAPTTIPLTAAATTTESSAAGLLLTNSSKQKFYVDAAEAVLFDQQQQHQQTTPHKHNQLFYVNTLSHLKQVPSQAQLMQAHKAARAKLLLQQNAIGAGGSLSSSSASLLKPLALVANPPPPPPQSQSGATGGGVIKPVSLFTESASFLNFATFSNQHKASSLASASSSAVNANGCGSSANVAPHVDLVTSLPPIIAGKRINLPLGPHRYL